MHRYLKVVLSISSVLSNKTLHKIQRFALSTKKKGKLRRKGNKKLVRKHQTWNVIHFFLFMICLFIHHSFLIVQRTTIFCETDDRNILYTRSSAFLLYMQTNTDARRRMRNMRRARNAMYWTQKCFMLGVKNLLRNFGGDNESVLRKFAVCRCLWEPGRPLQPSAALGELVQAARIPRLTCSMGFLYT
jgi:hypothetical protein